MRLINIKIFNYLVKNKKEREKPWFGCFNHGPWYFSRMRNEILIQTFSLSITHIWAENKISTTIIPWETDSRYYLKSCNILSLSMGIFPSWSTSQFSAEVKQHFHKNSQSTVLERSFLIWVFFYWLNLTYSILRNTLWKTVPSI